MRKVLSLLASLKVTVVLVLLLGVVLSAGTILESLNGPEAAKSVYEAGWFYALLCAFALNVVAALVERWPKNRWRAGFLVTHASMLLILFGAFVTLVSKREGRIALWEGEQSKTVVERPGAPGDAGTFTLPFAIKLDDFQMDLYPGTRRPAMFRSRVEVLDPQARAPRPAVIEMNKPLAYGGFHFFQSSYQIENGREMSILSVSRDPGQPIVFFGYGLLVAGMILVFATRLVQFKKTTLARAAAVVLAGVALAVASAAPAQGAQVPPAATIEKLRVLPVQHDGRSMPFDTQAREAVRTVTGSRSWWDLDSVAVVAGWAFDPQGWRTAEIVKVGGSGVADTLGLPRGTRHTSFERLVALPNLRPALAAVHAREEADEKSLTGTDKDLLKLEERLGELYGYLQGTAIRSIPSADPKGTWQVAPGVRWPADLAAVADRVRASGAPAHYPTPAAIARELTYNRMRPTRLAWLLLLPAALVASVTVAKNRFGLRLPGALLLVGGFAAMTWGIALRWQIAGRVPAANMYESMLFLGWGVGLFGVIALALRQRLLIANAAGMGALAMMLADLLPIDGFIHPVMPVLSGTPWLAIHVPIIVISYSVLAMATGIGHMVIGVEIFAPKRKELAARWSQLLYWYLHVGSILLIAGILTGSIWAASSWGRYWGWDPKEVWSLVAFLAYMAILHARFDEQIKAFGVAAASIAAFWTILMTYLGVNFVLASGLHAYGFGSSNLVSIMGLIAIAEIAFLGAGWRAHRRAATATADTGKRERGVAAAA